MLWSNITVSYLTYFNMQMLTGTCPAENRTVQMNEGIEQLLHTVEYLQVEKGNVCLEEKAFDANAAWYQSLTVANERVQHQAQGVREWRNVSPQIPSQLPPIPNNHC